MKQLTELNEISNRVDKIVKELQLLITNLPDNPNIKRLPNSNAFTISSSQLFRNKDNPTLRMDVFFYDFKAQYKYISGVIKRAKLENVVSLLQQIVSKGTWKGIEYKSFNPIVITHLKNLLENA